MQTLRDRLGTRNAALLAGAALVLAIVLSYLPALQAGFIWDDDVYVTNNRLLREPDGLRRIWFSRESPSQYFPLVYTAFRAQYAFFGAEPLGYHIVNVLLHAANALLLWAVLRRLALPGAWLAAALFALHPVQVESVAWVTELKNVLSTFFSLLTALAWLRFDEREERPAWGWYAFALGAYALALFSKTTALTLPVALLLISWLRGRSLTRRLLLALAPLAAVGLAMGGVTIWWERSHQGTFGEGFDLPIAQRFLIAGRAIWFHLGKLAWPANLTFSYPRWEISASDWRDWLWLAAAGAAAAAIWLRRSAFARGPAAAFAFHALTLSPLLGFVPLYTFIYSFAADHYQYLAAAGPLALAAAALSRRWTARPREQAFRTVAAAALLCSCALLTWRQARVYESPETLWRDTVAKNPRSWMGWYNLGNALRDAGRYAEAAESYRRVLRIDPNYVMARLNLGLVALRLGDRACAIEQGQALAPVCPPHADRVRSAIQAFDRGLLPWWFKTQPKKW